MSNSANKEDIVFFQKDISSDYESLAYAWKVIRQCGYANFHPFVFPTQSHVSAADAYGNYMPLLAANAGQAFQVSAAPSGNVLSYLGRAGNSREIQLCNNLKVGAVSASLFKDGRLLCRKTAIAPAQKAVFVLKPSLFVGVVSQVTEGQPIASAVMSSVHTELSLLGVARADIVLTGGGPGPKAGPFQFNLENVVMT